MISITLNPHTSKGVCGSNTSDIQTCYIQEPFE